MYTNILLPVLFGKDHDTESAFQIAQALAGDGTQFTIIHVLEPIPSYAAAEIPAHILKERHAEAEAALQALADKLSGAKTAFASGQAGRAIVQYARENSTDCIVLASHKPGLENFFLGSTADRVVRHATCAVHVIR